MYNFSLPLMVATARCEYLDPDRLAVLLYRLLQAVAHADRGVDELVLVAALGKGIQVVAVLYIAHVDGGGVGQSAA